MQKQKPVSTRLSLKELAKARDALLASGISADQLDTVSQIIRLSVFTVVMSQPNFDSMPSAESLDVLGYTFSEKN